jgi:ankyrin repeat protein
VQELAGQADLAGLTAALNSGINVNSQDEQGCSALHFAADRGHLEVVRLLLAAGAEMNMQVVQGC